MRLFQLISLTWLIILPFSNKLLSQVKRIDLPTNLYAFSFQEDSNKRVWLGLSDGNQFGQLGFFQNDSLTIISGHDSLPAGSFHVTIKLPDESFLFAGHVLDNFENSVIVWVHDQGADTIRIPFRLKIPLINCLALVNNKEIWIGTANGLIINKRGDWSWLTTNDGLPSNFVSTIYQDFRGVVWIGTESGVVYFADNQIYTISSGSKMISKANLFFEDNKGYVWCGDRFTAEGVSVFNGEIWETFSGRNGLLDNSVSVFYQDIDENIWVGSCYNRQRGGVSVFNGKTWEGFTSPEHLAKQCVDAIISDSKGRIWLGGSLSNSKNKGITVFDNDGWIKIRNSSELPAERVITFFLDSERNVWISSFEGLYVVGKDFTIKNE